MRGPTAIDLQLRLFHFPYAVAERVGSWALAPDEAEMWNEAAGPVPAERVLALVEPLGVLPYTVALTGAADGDPVGYGELWIDDDLGQVAVTRLLVSPRHRQRGIGTALLKELAERALDHHGVVQFSVPANNVAGRNIAHAAGFVRTFPTAEDGGVAHHASLLFTYPTLLDPSVAGCPLTGPPRDEA